MDTLRDYILGSIIIDEEEWNQTKEANRLPLGNDDKHLKNLHWGREATAEEKAAIEYDISLQVKGMQKALKDAGEAPLSPKDISRYWKFTFEESVSTLDLPKLPAQHKKLAQKDEQILIEECAQNYVRNWKSMPKLQKEFEDPNYRPDQYGQMMRRQIAIYRNGRV